MALSFRALAFFSSLTALEVQRTFAVPLHHVAVSELPLNDEGYQEVAGRKSDDNMKHFIRRVVAKLGGEVTDEGDLSGFTSYFSGATDVQDYARLEAELRLVGWTRPPVINEESSAPQPAAAPHVEAGQQRSLAQARTGSPMSAFATVPTPTTLDAEALRRIPSVTLAEAASRQHEEATQAAAHASAGPVAKPVVKARAAGGSLYAAEAPPRSQTARWHSDEAVSSPSSKAHGGRKHNRGIRIKKGQLKKALAHSNRHHRDNERVRSGRKHHRTATTKLHAKVQALRAVSHAVRPHHGGYPRLSLLGFDSHVANGAEETAADKIRPAGQVLPAVGEVLSTASQTLEDFSKDTNQIRVKVDERQKALKEKMVLARGRFEAKLKDYQQHYANITMANDKLRDDIRTANQTNADLVADATDTQHSIHILQDTLLSLQGKMLHAEGFVDDSLNTTDVSNATVVQVLAPTTPPPTLDTFLLKARKELGLTAAPAPPADADVDEPVGLLQLGADYSAINFDTSEETATPNAERMTSLLSGALEHLERVEEKVYRQLRSTYLSSKEKWVTRINLLLVENKQLEKQYDVANQRKADLQTASQVLEETNELLVRKLGDFTLFLAHVNDAALKTVGQVKGKVEAL